MKFSELELTDGLIAKRRDGSMITFFRAGSDLAYVNARDIGDFKYVYSEEGLTRDIPMLDIMAVYNPAKFDGNTVDFGEPIWERPVDWSTVKVDTPILVSSDNNEWYKRYFSRYEDGIVFAFANGTTSWSSQRSDIDWRYAKLVP